MSVMLTEDDAVFIKAITHNDRYWQIVRFRDSFFARVGTNDTGPYSTVAQAEEFIKAIRP